MSKWILVTGAARRIGRAIALELAEGGWNVIVHYHESLDDAAQTAKDIVALGRKAHLAKADLADKRETEDLIPSLIKKIGPFFALVNNASLFEPDAQAPGGRDHKAVNVEAPRILTEVLRAQLPRGKSGSVVNILDSCVPEPGFGAYAASKKSLRVMTIELARRFAPELRVNGVAPGPVLQGPRQSMRHFKQLVDATLLKTEITPQAVAAAVRLLIENPSIAGEILHIDGGIRLQNTPVMPFARAG